MAAEQKPEVQRLFQSGSYEQAVEAARDGDPASTYLAAQSLLKLDRTDRAGAEMTRLARERQPGVALDRRVRRSADRQRCRPRGRTGAARR